jgi:uncharacterized membrane protein
MKIINKYLAYFITALTFIATAIIYPKLPNKIPMHWNINGAIDRYGARWQAYLLPIILLVFIVIMKVAPKIDPKKENYKSFQKYYDVFIIAFTILFAILQVITLKASFDPTSVSMNTIMPMLIGLFFAVIGILLPKFDHNYFVGVKTPWTLADPENWKTTHKFAGPLWVIGGLLITLTSIILPSISFMITMVIIFVIAIVPIVYSYLLYRKKK